jgi:hypothetical protein
MLGAVAAVAAVVGYVAVLALTVASRQSSWPTVGGVVLGRVPVTRCSTGPVTTDELIEVHTALANVTSLRAIARGASAVRNPDPTSALGGLTGIAPFFGLVMNFNYLLAGAVSTNPILGVLALFVILAWRLAGYYGLDRYLLPILGTPWTGPLPKALAPANVPSNKTRVTTTA